MGVLGLHLGAAAGALDREVGWAGLDLGAVRLRRGFLFEVGGHGAIVPTPAIGANDFVRG